MIRVRSTQSATRSTPTASARRAAWGTSMRTSSTRPAITSRPSGVRVSVGTDRRTSRSTPQRMRIDHCSISRGAQSASRPVVDSRVSSSGNPPCTRRALPRSAPAIRPWRPRDAREDLAEDQAIGLSDRLAAIARPARPTRLPRRRIPEIPEDRRAQAAGGVRIRDHPAQLRVLERLPALALLRHDRHA